jgi:hypothetical protein
MKSFQEFNADEDLEEALVRSGWVKAAALALQARVSTGKKKVQAADTTDKKFEALASMIADTAMLTTLGLAAGLKDRSLLKKHRR